MSKFLYTTGIYVYWLVIRISSVCNPKANDFIRGRKAWLQQLKNITSKDKAKWIWVHCSSLGEFEQGKPVIDKIKQNYPDYSILLSFFSPSGYNARKNYSSVDAVVYMPMDVPKNAKQFVETLNPEFALFIKYEFWYHHLRQLKQKNIPVFLISATFRQSQVFFKWYGNFFRTMLDFYDAVFLQDQHSQQLVNNISDTETQVCGDTRFDRVKEIAQKPFQNDLLDAFVNNQYNIMIAGSTWPADEKLIADCMDKCTGVKLVLVPHEVDNKHIAQISELFNKWKLSFYNTGTTEEAENADVLVVDTIGILSNIYRYGHFAFVGGGFGKGIHNILEPASYHLPVVFGPKFHRFIEARELIRTGAAFSVNSSEELCHVIQKCSHEKFRDQCEKSMSQYLHKKSGATIKICRALQKFDVLKT
ncbi:MAG: 3-deoxy-D-manno-octulosonic acid transferase [Candidatus Delongbacteria bacterium]|jgi:3-deoxy-D-manno-octulosonic-acid transferase|nr:3-deoxy-D-manno-octulosonic acid transferase [Candidatus Delongbacteria bacterium]